MDSQHNIPPTTEARDTSSPTPAKCLQEPQISLLSGTVYIHIIVSRAVDDKSRQDLLGDTTLSQEEGPQ